MKPAQPVEPKHLISLLLTDRGPAGQHWLVLYIKRNPVCTCITVYVHFNFPKTNGRTNTKLSKIDHQLRVSVTMELDDVIIKDCF